MVFDTVKNLISEQLDVKADDITEASNIQDDLGADSLDVVDLVMALEDEFDVEIPEDQVENIKTVGDIVKFIEDTMALRTPKHRSF
jgi:acyl carrier protein